eukprot:1599955-Lingulodinium_polyedra.AAC.1
MHVCFARACVRPGFGMGARARVQGPRGQGRGADPGAVRVCARRLGWRACTVVASLRVPHVRDVGG